jgi:NADPH:quinone reductase
MRAATVRDSQIVIEEHPDPEPGSGELLVRVRAAGLNGGDSSQRRGLYQPPPNSYYDIPGLELAGEVVELGPGATRFEIGARVMAFVVGGAQAELAVVNERQVMLVPAAMDRPAAGGLPVAFTTAHDALFTWSDLHVGERLLVNGEAGGVGTAAIQLAHAAGAHVTTTVRNEALRESVAELGAEVVEPEGFAERGPFDVILELVGAPYMSENLHALATGGRIAVIGVGGGETSELDLRALMAARGRIHSFGMRARPPEERAPVARKIEHEVLPLFETGTAKVLIADTFPLDEAAASAYDRFESGGTVGKIVVTL